ncbi:MULTISPECIES: hypothetical protein [Peribacillus]|uniref:Uncharacterized protein n=1 Tax=Peribacillus simplex TaxID=1478 RepID=A0A109N2K3_9BACI|nr:hypothetical protein [Peribacillus simplex]KWW22340.1 hypothetical protein AS888_12440 [Peribacillus simplex]
MRKVLIVGKGDLYKSVKGSIGATHTDTSNLEIVDYDEEWLMPTRELEDCDGLMVDKSNRYSCIYLFPNCLLDGINLVRIFSGLKHFRLFVVTHHHRNSSLYKKMGADFVIVSKPDGYSYDWLLTSGT